MLPPNGQGESPDEDGANAVQHHPGSGVHSLCDGEAGEVEEGNAHDETEVGKQKLPVVSHLDNPVDGILEPDVVLPEIRTRG